MHTADPHDGRRTGALALTGGLLLAAGAGVETLVPVQADDGAVVRPLLFTAYLLSWTVGAAALTLALSRLRRAAAVVEPQRRAGRATGCSVLGAALLGLFGAVALGTGLVQGRPYEPAFLLFALGLLLLVVGAVALGIRLRRTRLVGRGWPLPLVAAVAAILGVVVPVDPWHDLGLLSCFVAWAALGAQLLRVPRTRRAPGRVGTSSGPSALAEPAQR